MIRAAAHSARRLAPVAAISLLAGVVLAAALPAASAQANSWYVGCGDISGFRDATSIANTNTTVTVELAAGCTYTFTDLFSFYGGVTDGGNAALETLSPSVGPGSGRLVIHGNGATVTRAASAPAMRFITADSGTSVTLQDLTVTGFRAPDGDGDTHYGHLCNGCDPIVIDSGHADGYDGGAVYSKGSVTLTDDTFAHNAAGNGENGSGGTGIHGVPGADGGSGGAVAVMGTVTVSRTSFTANTAGSGGDGEGDLSGDGSGGSGGSGGGLYMYGTGQVSDSSFSSNVAGSGGSGGGAGAADGFDGSGGGAAGVDDSTALTITATLFQDNHAFRGGGAWFDDADGTVLNSTFDSNSGGAVGGYGPNASYAVRQATLVGNSDGGDGDALQAYAGAHLAVSNTVLSGNGNPGADCDMDWNSDVSAGTITNGGGLADNVADGSCPSPTVIATPGLGALQDNGGFAASRMPGAALIDAGSAAACAADDQRHVARPQGSGCDLGAVEKASSVTVGDIVGVTKTLAEVDRGYSITATHPQGQPIGYSWDVTGVAATIVGGTTASPTITFHAPGTATVKVQVGAQNASTAESVVKSLTVEVGPADDHGPTISLQQPLDAFDEGDSHTFAYTVSDPEGDPVTVDPGYPTCGNSATVVSSTFDGADGTVTCHFDDGPAVAYLAIRASDYWGVKSDEVNAAYLIQDVLPTIALVGPTAPGEGVPALYSYTITDPGTDDTYTSVVTECVPTVEDEIAKVPGSDTSSGTAVPITGSFQCAVPRGDQSGYARVSVYDGAQLVAVAKQNFTVKNTPPVVTITGPTTVDEDWLSGDLATFGYTATDAGYTPTVLYNQISCGSGNQVVSTTTDSFTCRFRNGPSTATLSVAASDPDTTTTATYPVAVRNVPPTLSFGQAGLTAAQGGVIVVPFHASDPADDPLTATPPAGCAPHGPFSTAPGLIAGAFDCPAPTAGAVELEMTLSDGTDIVTASTSVTVSATPPAITAAVSTNATTEDVPFTLTPGAITGPTAATVTQWRINWGDGTSTTLGVPPAPTAHAYSAPGNYLITMDLLDENGWELTTGRVDSPTINPNQPVLTVTDEAASANEFSTSTFHFTISEPGSHTYDLTALQCGQGTVVASSISGTAGEFTCRWGGVGTSGTVLIRVENEGGQLSNPVQWPVNLKDVLASIVFSPDPVSVVEDASGEVDLPFTVQNYSLTPAFYSAPRTNCGTGTYLGIASAGAARSYYLKCRFPNGPLVQTVTVASSENGTDFSGSRTIQVLNAPPALVLGTPASVPEGTPVDIPMNATDPGSDTVTVTSATCGADGTYLGASDGSVQCRFPDGPASENVSATVSDGDGGTAAQSIEVQVADVAPTIAIGGSTTEMPGTPHPITLGTITDPGHDTVTGWVVHWGDGATDSYTSATPDPTHAYSGVGPYAITVDLVDEDGTHLDAGATIALEPDTSAPTIAPIASFSLEATGPHTVVDFTPVVTDDRPGAVAVCYDPPGSTEPWLGNASPLYYSCTAQDAAGNWGNTVNFQVQLLDTTAPTITPLSSVTAEATAPATPVSFPLPTAADAVDPFPTVACDHAPGSGFPVGTTRVSCSAVDAAGSEADTAFDVTVTDTTDPTIHSHPDVTAEATGAGTTAVSFDAPAATDAADGALTPDCAPASGSGFPLDTPTTVTCTATDSSGNSASTTFTVTVHDTAPPTVTAVGATVPALSDSGTLLSDVDLHASATDTVDGALTPTCTIPGGILPPETTTEVTCTATDAHGNTGMTAVQVTVSGALIADHDVTAGDHEAAVTASSIFAAGDYVEIDRGGAHQEVRLLSGIGSIISLAPYGQPHAVGETVYAVDPPLGDRTAPTAALSATSVHPGEAISASCDDGPDGVGVEACVAPAIDTASLGTHHVVVQTWDRNGNLANLTLAYTVAAPLAATGSDPVGALALAAVLALTGLVVVGMRRRSQRARAR